MFYYPLSLSILNSSEKLLFSRKLRTVNQEKSIAYLLFVVPRSGERSTFLMNVYKRIINRGRKIEKEKSGKLFAANYSAKTA